MASGNVLFPFADLCSAVALQVEPNIRFRSLGISVARLDEFFLLFLLLPVKNNVRISSNHGTTHSNCYV